MDNYSSKTCKKCLNHFQITDSDRNFYNRMKVPEPSLCPDCRMQRRMAFRNERNLYQRDCDLCGKKMLSIYNREVPYKVYCLDCWWSDKWDPKDYARDYDFKRPFFDQFYELQKEVPHMALLQVQNENSDYTNYVSHLKDCYLLFSADFNRDCYYGVWIKKCQNCVDNLILNDSELTYESFFSHKIYNGVYILHSSQCSDSSFLYNCKNCSHCFMSYGLRNKQYCIYNKQLSGEDYFKELRKYNLGSYKEFELLKKEFFEYIKGAVYMYMRKDGRIINSTGDLLANVENCIDCYEITDSKDCKYIHGGFEIKDVYDGTYVNGELGYENCECVPMPFNSAFCLNSYSGSDLKYCDMCIGGNKNLFGCVSLRHNEYCILNKKYSKEEYEELLPKIIETMRQKGEYGEFFPAETSPFAYNETNADEFFPLNKEEAVGKGFKWKETDSKDYQPQNVEIPDNIEDVPDELVNEVLSCGDCGKNYKIIPQELKFYKDMELPVPGKCFECRHKERGKLRNLHHLYERKCSKCRADIKTTYSEDRPEKVYCEECYLKELV